MKNTFRILAAVSLAIVVAACCPCRRQTNVIPLTGAEWSLVQLNDEKVSSKNFRMTLNDKGEITGIGDCNRFNGSFKSNGSGKIRGDLSVGQNLISTRMMCPNQAMENNFMKMLLEIDSWNIDGEKLMLIKEGDVLAIFEPTIPAADTKK